MATIKYLAATLKVHGSNKNHAATLKIHGNNKKNLAAALPPQQSQILLVNTDKFLFHKRSKMAANNIEFEDEYENNDETTDLTDEEEIIRFYFYRGFHYEEILNFLRKFHDHEMSSSALKRRIKRYGLQPRNSDYEIDAVRDAIRSLLDGPRCCRGYRAIWHTPQMSGMTAPRVVVAELLREPDPEGVQERSTHRLKRRVYRNPGPNFSWHCDGYDKLKPYGFPIHGCIDGWNRKWPCCCNPYIFSKRSKQSQVCILSF